MISASSAEASARGLRVLSSTGVEREAISLCGTYANTRPAGYGSIRSEAQASNCKADQGRRTEYSENGLSRLNRPISQLLPMKKG